MGVNSSDTPVNSSGDDIQGSLRVEIDGKKGDETGSMAYPDRPGERDCAYYLRTGMCGYGDDCKFNHPTNNVQGNMSPVLSTYGLTSVDHVYPSSPGSHPPERPGEPECLYFMNNGTCKYGSECKYHHPRENMVKPDASSFGTFGLPLRPGQPMCSYYMLYGICKYGPGCKYDHPLMAYSYNYLTGLTSLQMVDPSLLSYGGMNSCEISPSKSLKNPGRTSEQIDNVKLGTDDSSSDHVGSSHSSSQNQSE
ncbi:hypothetical protein L1987_84771 [Smallanthus sonchifolius]|uniref:Uncharacterized protein n=1 Tax=Smallanthus sonchifolius TaxID=185202 RepID=A0ACB8XYT6_9ASTR|nr:hypothetical protein L1987_84771 [Smallanthus sonchifolius]